MNQRKIYWCKNGRSFASALIRAADNDKQVTKMFADNIMRFWPIGGALEKAVEKLSLIIKSGNFKLALYEAFDWKYSHEKEDFWSEVHSNINNIN